MARAVQPERGADDAAFIIDPVNFSVEWKREPTEGERAQAAALARSMRDGEVITEAPEPSPALERLRDHVASELVGDQRTERTEATPRGEE